MDKDRIAGFIYVLTNPAFPGLVKIGCAGSVEDRLRSINRNPALPSPFHIFCTLEVPERLTDTAVHAAIDKIVPGLRTAGPDGGAREFYRLTAEDAYGILEGIAAVGGLRNRPRLHAQNAPELPDGSGAEATEDEDEGLRPGM